MWEVRRAPVNPPSPAFRGLRGLRLTDYRAAGPLALFVGLRSRPSSDKPQSALRRAFAARQMRLRVAPCPAMCVCEVSEVCF